MPIAPGTRLGPYVVQDFIGQGAMGVVYRAYHAQLERTGAVKVLQGLAPDADSTARFRREAQAIAHMRHSNILNVFDFGEFEGTPYMIVEYVDGGNLSARLKSSAMSLSSAIEYLRAIGHALDYAHSLGIVHRDVKPANVLLGPDNTPILADFGLVKLMQSSSIKSMTGVTTGTPAYMAPEQVTGSQVGPAADRYSLAVMAYEMLTGTLPFDDDGVLEILYAHVHRAPPAPSSRSGRLGARVDAVILRGLAKDPQARWETCASFVAALDAALKDTSPVTQKTIAFAPPVPGAGMLAAAPAVPAPAAGRKQKRSHRTRYFIAAALILLIIAGMLVYNATRPPSVTVSSSTVQRGSYVVVMASNVPGNQTGVIQLNSQVHTYPFHSDAGGDVNQRVLIPADIGLGDHLLQICWAGACHAQTIIHVVASMALATPGVTPARPTTSPSWISSSPSASPSSASAPAISMASYTIRVHNGSDTVTGSHFGPGKGVFIRFFQSEQGGVTNAQVATTVVASNGTFAKQFSIPSSAVVGQAVIRACDANGLCAFAYVTVVS